MVFEREESIFRWVIIIIIFFVLLKKKNIYNANPLDFIEAMDFQIYMKWRFVSIFYTWIGTNKIWL